LPNRSRRKFESDRGRFRRRCEFGDDGLRGRALGLDQEPFLGATLLVREPPAPTFGHGPLDGARRFGGWQGEISVGRCERLNGRCRGRRFGQVYRGPLTG
jgi:hypothetical protein